MKNTIISTTLASLLAGTALLTGTFQWTDKARPQDHKGLTELGL